jgi:hypothetical protein
MAAVQYNQVQSLPLYASTASGDAGVPGYWAGYRPSSRAAFAATATLVQTWNDIGGTYLFLASAPGDFAAFSGALTDWLPDFGPAVPPRFLWLENPEDPAFYWRAVGWFATGVGSGSGTAWTTFGVSALVLGGYQLQVTAGAALTLDVQEPARAVLAAGHATFFGPGAAFGPSGASAIGFQGNAIGAWTGQLTAPADGLGALGVELRYAVRHSVDPADPRLDPVSMPILGAAAAAMSLAATWDPLNPQVRGRSGLRFAASSPAIDSYFVTQRGYATTLTPVGPPAAPWPGGLMFCRCATRIDSALGQGGDLYSLAPDGAFALTVTPPSNSTGTDFADELMLGLSGLETVQIASAGTLVVFDAGRAAFAPGACPDGTIRGDGTTLLNELATTAWVSVVPSAAGRPGLLYYAQPRQSPLFTGGGSAVMDFQPVPAARLGSYQGGSQSQPSSFPVGAYSGVAGASAAAARALERAALAPLRRRLVTGRLPGLDKTTGDADVLAITPAGLVVTLQADLSEISGVVIANLPESTQPQLAFNRVGADFEAALLASELFFVVSNATTFLDQASCLPPFALDLDGWRFRLDPSRWRAGDAPTLMIWKYANRPLEALAADTAVWGWQSAARDSSGSMEPTRKALDAVILEARRAGSSDQESPLARFYREVVADPAWNGVLFLNAPVDLASLPDSLRFVAAGLDPDRFYAHHVGVGLTPFDPATVPITLKKTSVFGLIDYADSVDLVTESTVPFAFKTMRLTARFANAHLADFAAQAELSLNRLFGSPLMKQEPALGNNLLLSGTLQKSGGAPSYAFSLSGRNHYNTLNAALTGVEITSVRVETRATPAAGQVTTGFALGGKLRFFAPEGFDPFGYGSAPAAAEGQQPGDGWLTFSQLVVAMDFPISDPSRQTWTVDETSIGFDLANSVARPDSLVACFPVTARAIVASPSLSPTGADPSGASPEDLGYPSISAPLDQTPMAPPWYGLVLTLDLGGLGALGGGTGLKAEILAAWMAGADSKDPPVYIGLKLPGTPSRNGSFPLQGALKLGFGSVVFSTYQQDGKRAYLLRLSRFALSVLGFAFPPGNLDVSLFGGPQGRSTGQLGWLAAYVEPDVGKSGDAVADYPNGQPRLARLKRLGRLPGMG